MSNQAPLDEMPDESVTLETGLEAFQSSSEFRGPVESLDGHDCNDHFAHVYETRKEKFEASAPFIRHGLERGERVMYVVDESTEAEVKAALRDAEIDVDGALDSGALSFHTVQDTYLRNGSFDTDEMIDFYGDTVAEVTREYEALRIVAEMTWIKDDDTSVEQVMEYEQRINDLFGKTDSLAICQYNRELFAPETIRNVLRTHPHLIYDGAACHNVYYTPPEEFFGEDAPARENDRMLRTLRDRTTAKAELQQHERFLQALYETTSDPNLEFEEKLDALFELGCDRFGLDLGGIAKVDPDANLFEVEHVSGDHDHLVPGARVDLSETYCRVFASEDVTTETAIADPVGITDPAANGFDDELCVTDFGVETYLGTHLRIDGGSDRTFFFVAEEPRNRTITDRERTFHQLMAQWVKYELERQQREQELRERTEHLSALVETTPECIKTVAEDGTLLQMNPAGVDMVEAPDESAVTGGCVYDLIAPEHREKFREFNERICGGERGTLEYDIIGREGTRRHMETHAAPLQRPDGETVHVALTRDVTEQVEREQQLEESEHRYRTLVENFPNGSVGLYDEDLTYSVVGGELLDELGVASEDIVGTTIHDRYPDEIIDRIEPHFRAVFDGDSNAFEIEFGDRDLLAHTLPVRDASGEIYSGMLMVQDVTERKERERALRESKEQLRALIEVLPVGVFVAEDDGELVEWNDTTEEIFGGEIAEADSVAEYDQYNGYWADTGDPVAPEEWPLARALQGEEVTDADEIVIEGFDGERRTALIHGMPIQDEGGEVSRAIVTVTDITDRKEREAELRQTKTRFETVFEQSGDSIFILDPDADELVDANAAAAEMTGYARDELVSLAPTDLHPDEMEQFRAFLDEVRETGSAWSEDLHYRHKDGHEIPVEITASTITLDGRDLVLALVRDIEERKKHERSQRELYEITADADLDTDQKIERLLELGCDHLGLPVGMLNHKRGEEIAVRAIHGDHPDVDEESVLPPASEHYCREVVETEKLIATHDAEAADWNDDPLYTEIGLEAYAGAPVTVDGQIYGTLCFADTSPCQASFTEAERSFLDLMSQYVSYELDRKQRERALEDSNERLEQFAYAASHDLQEPLRMVTSYLQLLENRYSDAFDEDGEEFLEYAADGAERMREMIDGLLEYSRVETRGDPFEPVELAAVLDDVREDLQIQIENTNAEITSEQLPCVEGDTSQLRQVFQNLLDNAITYSDDEPPDIYIDAERQGQEWVISVHDNGIGIDPDDQDRVFTVFDRLHNRDEYDGTGLGLALCQRIIERHDGDIWVESEPGEGSTFSFTLPAV